MGLFSGPLHSIRQTIESGQRAKGFQNRYGEFRADQQKISDQLKAWGAEDWDQWVKTFAPAEEATIARAKEGFKPQTDRATGRASSENARTLSGVNATVDSTLSKRSINPASGRAIAARAGLSNAGAAKTGTDINIARTGEENRVNDMNWNNRLNLVGVGSRGLSDQALMLTKASDVIGTGARRMAGLSDSYSNIATAGLSGAGRGVGRLVGKAKDAYSEWSNRDVNTGPDSHEPTDYQWGDNNAARDDFNSQNDAFGDDYSGSSFADGGLIVGPGTGTSDSIPANIDGQDPASVSNGEYRIPASAVAIIGRAKLDAIVAKYHQKEAR